MMMASTPSCATDKDIDGAAHLYLAFNRFQSTIPADWGRQMPSLTVLRLESNSLTGKCLAAIQIMAAAAGTAA